MNAETNRYSPAPIEEGAEGRSLSGSSSSVLLLQFEIGGSGSGMFLPYKANMEQRWTTWSWRAGRRAFFWRLSRRPSRGPQWADFWPPLEMADAQRRRLRGHRRRLACCGRSTTEDSRWGEQPRSREARGARAAFRGERRMEVGLRSTYKKTNSLAPGAGWAPGLVSGLFAGRWAVFGGWRPLTFGRLLTPAVRRGGAVCRIARLRLATEVRDLRF